MAVIWKFPIEISDEVAIEMPRMNRILHVGVQGSQWCLWALVDPAAERKTHRFRIFGTGQPVDMSDVGDHVATWQDGPFVWHLFREGGESDG